MSYFILSQDGRIPDAVEPVGIVKAVSKDMLIETRIEELASMNLQFPIRESKFIEYVDFIERPVPLLSNKLKQLVEKFLPRQQYYPVGLIDLTRMRQDAYWLTLPQRIDCLSDKSEYHLNGTLKRPVLDIGKLVGNCAPLFQVLGVYETILVVNLTLAESIMRRDFYGIKLKKLDEA